MVHPVAVEFNAISQDKKQKVLPGGELNPGLPRDRRGYSPLYYRGLAMKSCLAGKIHKQRIAFSGHKSAIPFQAVLDDSCYIQTKPF